MDYYEALSLYVMEGTTQAAKISCGGVIESCLAVARGDVKKSVAIVRPPGHHAEPDEHMGFCFLNNVAVGARVVQQMTNLKRILILDWYVIVSMCYFVGFMYNCSLQGIFITVRMHSRRILR